MRQAIIVGAGGFLGTILRYFVAMIPLPGGKEFPLATLAINVLGSLAMGVFAGLSERLGGHAQWMAFFRIGICGGFTTFSSFALEMSGLFGAGRPWAAIAYALISLIMGVVAIAVGRVLVA